MGYPSDAQWMGRVGSGLYARAGRPADIAAPAPNPKTDMARTYAGSTLTSARSQMVV